MAIINISQKDIDQQKMVDPGFHGVHLEGYTEKVNKQKDGTNYIFELKVVSDGSNKDRYCFHLVSSKQIVRGMVPVICAFEQVDPKEFQPADVDLDKLVGKTCIIEVEHEIYEGRQQVRVKNFFPATATGIELNS